jgi:hypothetical protein
MDIDETIEQRCGERIAAKDRARHALRLVRCCLPIRELVVVGDHTYAAIEWLDAVHHGACVIPTQRPMNLPHHARTERTDASARQAGACPPLRRFWPIPRNSG